MPVQNHPDYAEELARLQETLGRVFQSLENTAQQKRKMGQESKRLAGDNSQEFIELMVNNVIQNSLVLKIRNLETAQSKPYFARVDFQENGKNQPEKLYIGKMCLTRDEDQRLEIVDWRAPVANLYYEGRLGETGYDCPEGHIPGQMSLKRQFSISSGELREIFDIDITTNDQFLQGYLGANADRRLKEIVATIQAEQNRIIRAEMGTPLIVQGVAGSGKTTIALHRIAYLIYNFAQSFQPENFMIIAPNRLFLNYISEVLPELGVERVKQSTFEDFALEIIGAKIKVKDANEKLVALVNRDRSGDDNEQVQAAALFKSSLDFKDLLDQYLARIEQTILPQNDLSFQKWRFFSRQEIETLFWRDYSSWPVFPRINQLKKHFTKRVKDRCEALIVRFQEECNLKIVQLKLDQPDSETRQQVILETIHRKEEVVQELKAFAAGGVKEYLRQIRTPSAIQYYRDFFNDPDCFPQWAAGKISGPLKEFIQRETLANLEAGYLEYEDLAPVLYLKYRLYGLSEKVRVKHVVIDEAQDFSMFQFYTLKNIIKDSSFTIFGDLAQGIHHYRSIGSWEEVRKLVFEQRAELLTMEQSYRTTVEIMEAANRVIGRLSTPGLVQAKPVIRHGEPVQILAKESFQDIAAVIAAQIPELKSRGYQSIAIIAKTAPECLELFRMLKKSQPGLVMITGKENEYRGELVIVPSYLSKGLEFDVVMIANASAERYGEAELDVKLLYVAMTRPLHRLDIYYCGELTPLLREGNRPHPLGYN
jgi:DNA helicase II / ATP-dependent DNA helicase PcrA